MQEIITQIQTFATNNGMLATLTSGSLVVWVVSNLKHIYHTVVEMITVLISFNVYNSYADNRTLGYELGLKQYLFNEIISSSKLLWEKTVNYDLSSRRTNESKSLYNTFNKCLAYGFSIRIINGKIVFCNRHTNNNNNTVTTETSLKVFFANKKRFTKWINDEIERRFSEILETRQTNYNFVDIVYSNSICDNPSCKNKRSMDSIFTNDNIHKKMMEDIKKFINNKETYKKMNYPYKYSAILEGVPGSGKSSSILAVASELNRDIEYINLATIGVSELISRLNNNTNSKIYVFEDIDALNTDTTTNRKDEKTNNSQTCVINTSDKIKMMSISLSDILNITDGLLSSDGAICLFTTNHIEKLDEAFLRKGRMNGIFKFEYMNSDTADRMVRYHLGHSIGKMKNGIKPAELQSSILNVLIGHEKEETLNMFLDNN